MLFNSIEYAFFLPIVFCLYWFVTNKNLSLQNAFIVGASYFFYGMWDWRFLSLIVFSTMVDYTIGNLLHHYKNNNIRKALLWVSILVNLGFLGVFKYYNFFVDSFVDAFSLFGTKPNVSTLKILLPVGISFYTFQTLSYTIDVYRNKLTPTKNFIAFAAFVSFFPQLVAGPIERATNLLPQFLKSRKFEHAQAVDGLRQILWGLVKKVVVADNCAHYVNIIFNNSADYNGSTLLLGAILFGFQIYCDFSGYSDIAIGTARLFGFKLMQNFAFPYFSRDIAEFWRRWHISLSTWFRDYLYIPLGGSRGSNFLKVRNVFIIFLVSGFWHGANWTFIVWGFLNALYFLPLLLLQKNRTNVSTVVAQNNWLPTGKEAIQMIITFSLVSLAWVYFRAENLLHANDILAEIGSASLFSIPQVLPRLVLVIVIVFVLIEWFGRRNQYAIESIEQVLKARPLRWAFYFLLIFFIQSLAGNQQEFIYFQF